MDDEAWADSVDPPDTSDAPPGARLADEARRLAEAVAGRLVEVGGQVREQAAQSVGPLLERHPEVTGHLAAAGGELAAAYRAFVAGAERRWASKPAPSERVTLDDD